uniref:Uncharacterized protein n=1 Tax=Meloidogyne enterolobii TaxID=390850 RepID=A0A6V7V1Z8_MELEN|nr:unnamed protein product [Meloidogyne enterolobii]
MKQCWIYQNHLFILTNKFQINIGLLLIYLFFIFPFVLPQSNNSCLSIGEWGQWGDWGQCITAIPINVSIQRRIRTCMAQPSGCNDAQSIFECPGPYSQVAACNTSTTTTSLSPTTPPRQPLHQQLFHQQPLHQQPFHQQPLLRQSLLQLKQPQLQQERHNQPHLPQPLHQQPLHQQLHHQQPFLRQPLYQRPFQ